MKKFTLTFALALAMSCSLSAQTINYALDNSPGTGHAAVCTLTELNDAQEATFQMWLKPTVWTDAKLLSQDNFSLETTSAGKIVLKTGEHEASISIPSRVNRWMQLTIVVNKGNVKVYLDNTRISVSGDAAETFSASSWSADHLACIIGEGFKGDLDEIRVWSKALEQSDFYWRNTLNPYTPDTSALVAYWKCDQDQCANLVDYTMRHHGELYNLSKKEVTDNDKFKYKVVTGYTSLMRFTDRGNINKDMFRMTNDVILLSGRIQEDGSLIPEYLDNSLVPTNAGYLSSFEGRQGLMDFQGKGSVMTAQDSRLMGDPRAATSYGPTAQISVGAWVYIDQWEAGAKILSQYQDDSNCFVVSLGNPEEQEVKVDICGTVATLKGKLQTGKWQYLTVYFNASQGSPSDTSWEPVKIGVGEMNDNQFVSQIYGRTAVDGTSVEMSGKDMTITAFPALQKATFTLGQDLDGKLDEVMLWASDRSAQMKNDATQPYRWNVGSWPNVFLNAYWKGDDQENPGKDSQTFEHMTDIIRGYFKGTRGAKVRLGIIYQGGEKWKTQILNKEQYVDNLIRDLKKYMPYYDGVDVDLEWMYSASDWNVYNHVVERIVKEVMADYPEKTLSCSLHSVSYNGFNKSLFDYVDYFTFQLYGPNIDPTNYNYYTNAYNSFINYGYPKDKILLSYSILTQTGVVEGYKDLFEKYGLDDAHYTTSLSSWNCNGTTKKFTSADMVQKKQNFVLDQGVRGTMYFDMGNDLKVTDEKSLIRAQNEIISSNVDTLITEVDMSHAISTGIGETSAAGTTGLARVSMNYGSQEISVVLNDAGTEAVADVYTLEGIQVASVKVKGAAGISVPSKKQTYVVRITQAGKIQTEKVFPF